MQYLKYIIAFIVIAGLVYFALVGLGAFTPEVFAALSASLIAIIFERFPWLKAEWDKASVEVKQLIMWIFLFVLVGGAFGLSCYNVVEAFPCTYPAGVIQAITAFALAAGLNQASHRLVKKKSP